MRNFAEPVETFLDGTVSLVRIDSDFQSHEQLAQEVDEAGLALSSLFPGLKAGLRDPQLELHPTIRHDQREAARDPVSIEYILHFDGSCSPVRPDATLVVAREAEQDAPPTRFVSTPRFLELAKQQGIFSNFDPKQVDAVFGYSAYYDQVQSLWLALEPNNQRLQEVIKNDLERDGVATRKELIQKLDQDPLRHKRLFPLITPHSITGQDSIMIDAGARSIGLESCEIDQPELDQAFSLLRLLLADERKLAGEGIAVEVHPLTGHGVAFPKEGLHNQVPHTNAVAAQAKRQMSVFGLVAKQ